MALTDKLTAIGDAIRGKTGKTEPLTLDQMATEINDIQTGGGDSSLVDAIIDRTIEEISSNVDAIGCNAFESCEELVTANFPLAEYVDEKAFYNCWGLVNASFPEVTDLYHKGLAGCSQLSNLYMPKLDYAASYAFEACRKLQNIDFPKLKNINEYAFYDCWGLESVNLPVLRLVPRYCFCNCSALVKVDHTNIPVATEIQDSGFASCSKLTMADFPKVKKLYAYAFSYCYNLKALVLRSETLCSLLDVSVFKDCYHMLGTANNWYNPNGDKDGYVYVPSALISSYEADSIWASSTVQFRALEDYTVDGTITGELDESKI